MYIWWLEIQFNLSIINSDLEYWYNTLFQWKKDLLAKKTKFVYKRYPCHGIEIESRRRGLSSEEKCREANDAHSTINGSTIKKKVVSTIKKGK